jgi:hypothetical protein
MVAVFEPCGHKRRRLTTCCCSSRWRDLARMRTSIRARATRMRSIRSLSRAEGVAESVAAISGVLELLWYVRSILHSFLPTVSTDTNAHNQVDDLLKPSVAQFCDACTNTSLAGACICALPKAHNRWRTRKNLLKTPIAYIKHPILVFPSANRRRPKPCINSGGVPDVRLSEIRC